MEPDLSHQKFVLWADVVTVAMISVVMDTLRFNLALAVAWLQLKCI